MILVHKVSGGIIEYVPLSLMYSEFQDKSMSKMNRINKNNIHLLGLDMNEWWVVDETRNASLAYKLRTYYPYFNPIEIDGELVDIKVWDKYEIYGEKPPEEKTPEQKEKEAKLKARANRRMTKLKLW